jgi:hypothetical protein
MTLQELFVELTRGTDVGQLFSLALCLVLFAAGALVYGDEKQ